MNIKEKARKFAEGKAMSILDQAIEEAYAEGYRDGYKDREAELPVELQENKIEYIDLGLPSGTKWSSDYEHTNSELMYLPYSEASDLNIPTKEQFEELLNNCKWIRMVDSNNSFTGFTVVGLNGKNIYLGCTGYIQIEETISKQCSFFWLKENEKTNNPQKPHAYLYSYNNNNSTRETSTEFCGYKLAIRLVK